MPIIITSFFQGICVSFYPLFRFSRFSSKSELLVFDVSACKENKRIVVHVPADPAQLEALNVLKILKVCL